MARSNEPLWWGPFSAGLMVAALFVPALILITGFLWPGRRPLDADQVRAIISFPLTRLFFVVVICLSFIHAAHKFRYILIDLGVKGNREAIAAVSYGIAVVLSIVTIIVAI